MLPVHAGIAEEHIKRQLRKLIPSTSCPKPIYLGEPSCLGYEDGHGHQAQPRDGYERVVNLAANLTSLKLGVILELPVEMPVVAQGSEDKVKGYA